MYLRKLIPLALFALAFTLPVLAQEPTVEYGQVKELRGVSKIFVDTGIDARQRDLIAKAIQKRLPNLEIVSRPEESDIHLRFSQVRTKDGETKELGTVVKIIGNNRVRVLYSFKDFIFPVSRQQDSITNLDEYTKPYLFAIEFIRAYRKVNGESKT
jgi:hypothetical protein